MSRCPHGLPPDVCAPCAAEARVLALAIALERAAQTIEGALAEYRQDRRADPAVIADVETELAGYRRLLAAAASC